MHERQITAENKRLAEDAAHAVFSISWGPSLGERQGGTVREDHSENGETKDYFLRDHARVPANARSSLMGSDYVILVDT